ncbi:MAG: DUF945 family protein [Candidatus Rariloculaceae bacterium]
MNKTVAAIVVLVAVAVIGIPPVIGSFTEQRVMAQAERVGSMSDDTYNFEVLEYEGGWFSSRVRVQARLGEDYVQQIVDTLNEEGDMAAAMTAMMVQSFLGKSMPLEIELGHGPAMFTDGPQFGVLSAVIRIDPETEGLDELLETLGVPYIFEVRTLTGVTGASRFTGDVPPMEIADDDAEISFSGFYVEGGYDFRSRQIDSVGTVDFLRANAPGIGGAAIENLSFSADVTGHSSILWLGEIATTLGNVTIDGITRHGPFDLTMTNAGASFDTALNDSGELVTIEGGYFIDSLTGTDGLDLTEASFDLGLRDFSREALEEYYAYSRLVANDPRTAPPLIPGIQDMLYHTLATAPTIQIGPATMLWQGEPFEADLRIDVDNSVLPPQDEFSMLDIRTITSAITVTGYTDMSEDIAEALAAESMKYQLRQGAAQSGNQIPEADLDRLADSQSIGMLLGLVAQGILVESDTGYRSDLLFENRELTINGTVFPTGLPL